MKRVVAILLSLLFVFCGTDVRAAEETPRGVRTVVIDAGHGGKSFPGAMRGGICEKDINLQIALKLGALVEKTLPQIKVVYTRTTDKCFSTNLAEDLQARCDIANGADADLFISIHSNAVRDTSVTGTLTLVMGESTKEAARNEEAIYTANKEELVDMSDERTAAIVRAYIQNLQFTYGEYSNAMARLVQKHYASQGRRNEGVRKQVLKVLYSSDMPSVLTEVGYMSNPAELKYITSTKGQNEIASALCAALKDYVAYVNRTLLIEDGATDGGASVGAGNTPKSETAAKPAVKAAAPTRSYSVQVMASSKRLPLDDAVFKSYAGKMIEITSTGRFPYKYCIGRYSDRKSAQAAATDIKKTFTGAFVVVIDDRQITSK